MFLSDQPDLVYAHLLLLNQCYEAMPANNKIVVFTDNLNVRKAFYGLVYNCRFLTRKSALSATRTGLVLDTKTFQITGLFALLPESFRCPLGNGLHHGAHEAVEVSHSHSVAKGRRTP